MSDDDNTHKTDDNVVEIIPSMPRGSGGGWRPGSGISLGSKGVHSLTMTDFHNDKTERLFEFYSDGKILPLEVEASAPSFSQDGDKKQFRVPKGC